MSCEFLETFIQECLPDPQAMGDRTQDAEFALQLDVTGGFENAAKADEIASLIEIGVIHRYVLRIGRALIDRSIAAITEINPAETSARFPENRTVVLGSSNGELWIGWVHRYALKLGCQKSERVDVLPGMTTVS